MCLLGLYLPGVFPQTQVCRRESGLYGQSLPGLPLLWLLGLPCSCVTVNPLTRMIDWVSWPLGKNIDKWIIALLKGLAAVKKFSILIEVSLAKIEKVGGPCPSLGMWPSPLLSSGSSADVAYKVLGSQ